MTTWKPQVIFNLVAYSLLAMTIKYLEISFIVRGDTFTFFQELLTYSLIPVVIATYIEKVII